jgi:type 1 fimbriae regulatory protein FimB
MPRRPPRGRSVKSASLRAVNDTTDGHERAKDFLSEGELATLLDSAKVGRHGVRDHLLLLVMFRHGLRVSEAVAFRRDEVDLDRGRLWVRRLKGGLSVEQPIAGDELRAFRRYLALANKGYDLRLIQDYLGHRDPRHTVHYTRTAGRRFEGVWR